MVMVSSDIIACLIERTMIGIILEDCENGTVKSPDCPLERCPYFNQCDISKNPRVIRSAAIKEEQL